MTMKNPRASGAAKCASKQVFWGLDPLKRAWASRVFLSDSARSEYEIFPEFGPLYLSTELRLVGMSSMSGYFPEAGFKSVSKRSRL